MATNSSLPYFDFEARMYDAKLVRWNTYDPMAEKDYGINPYVYCAGDPVNMIDPEGAKVYMLFYTTNEKMFKASAETRKKEIEAKRDFDSDKDIVLLFGIRDLGGLKKKVKEAVDKYSEEYGQTTEVGIWSHAGFDGPIGVDQTSGEFAHYNQMTIEGWNNIIFNWAKQGANILFYGCNGESALN